MVKVSINGIAYVICTMCFTELIIYSDILYTGWPTLRSYFPVLTWNTETALVFIDFWLGGGQLSG